LTARKNILAPFQAQEIFSRRGKNANATEEKAEKISFPLLHMNADKTG
jgi:hypothetical protein